jgi:2-oxoisovalerate dehydrogenase E1 component
MSKLIRRRAPATCHKLQTTDKDLQTIDRDDLVYMLFLLHLIRAFELEVLTLKDEDLIHGPVHASIGQEAVAVAVSIALRKTDLVASTHRAHGHFLSKAFVYYAPQGYSPLRDPVMHDVQRAVDRTLAEIMGLKDGWCGGRGGSMHLYDATSGNLGSNAIVGGGIPIATGAAWAQRLQDKDRVVVSYFGDGAINQGCFHEVANMAALWNAPVLYLVENNLYAVGTCTSESSYVEDLALRSLGYGFSSLIVDGMDPVNTYVAVRDAVAKMRHEPFPFLIEAKTYRYYHHGGGLPGSAFGYRDKSEESRWQKRDPCTAFPRRLIDLGIVDPQDDECLRAMADEMVEHAANAYTAKEEGRRVIPSALWPPAESASVDVRCEDDVFDGVAFVEQEDFSALKPMTYVQAIAGVTLRNMERDDRVIVLGEEVANLRGGAYAATRGIVEVFPERLINTPISETGFVGMAGGLASVGLKPVVEVMFPDFAMMASDQLFNQIGKLRHMYGGQVCFPIVVRTRVAIGFGYGGQHSMDPSALFALFSGWRIVAPSNAFDYIGLFNTAVRLNDPVLVIEHGMLYGEEFPVPTETMDYYIPYGKAKVVRPGTDVTVLTYLTGVSQCVQVADKLAAEGISAEVIDLRTLDYTGMDYGTIGQSVQKTGSVLIVEQGPRSLTLGGRISDEIQERFFDYLDCPTAKVTAVDVPPPVSRKLEEAVLPSLAQIKEQMARSGRHMS